MNGYASLSCYGDAIDFASLSGILKPDSIRLKGATRWDGKQLPHDVWTYSSRQMKRHRAPDRPLDYLLGKLYKNPKILNCLKNPEIVGVERKTIGMLLNINGTNTSFRIALRHIKFAALLNADLWFDCWRTKPREMQNYQPIDWSCLKKGSQVTVGFETDFENCDVRFTLEQVQRLAILEIEPMVYVW